MGLENGWTATDNKSKKYDRQLRIWGAHGQALLEQSKICLLRCGPTGSETLKNLVLGGTGAFTVVDDAKVLPVLDTAAEPKPCGCCRPVR